MFKAYPEASDAIDLERRKRRSPILRIKELLGNLFQRLL